MDCVDKDSLYHIFLEILRLHYYCTHVLLDEVGVYPGQPPMLFVLSKEDGQSQKELANKLNLKPATITVMLKRMEKANLVERRQDAEDQRVSRVYITEQGKEVYEKVNKIMKNVEEECFGNFTVEEKVILRRLLMQMKNNLLTANDKQPSI
ncbi:MarR family transcriptional regulator [Tissierella sp. MSJ-40]|uniref:MarR family transcriptional regulator n=1 Tax=Tissierella simiarum TaxID=2841534 RepID=A0ABS6E7Y8_9FIRM|nr:MarR family transcriptional regulator [Tissierella simiarum]MBU5438897.1 MarR family transcriptional regulator [Tissierella simiarum]